MVDKDDLIASCSLPTFSNGNSYLSNHNSLRLNLSLFIARRYFFSKKSQRVINIISLISVIGVAVGTAALIAVLSVFNGFEQLVLSLYNSFDPDIKVTPVEGKTFESGELTQQKTESH
jgi:ABC-type lipoprotein release transport system permease subunit